MQTARSQPDYRVNITEAATGDRRQVGATIARVQATDADAGTNGEVRYAIIFLDHQGGQGGGAAHVTVNALTGVLTLRAPFDYEVRRLDLRSSERRPSPQEHTAQTLLLTHAQTPPAPLALTRAQLVRRSSAVSHHIRRSMGPSS